MFYTIAWLNYSKVNAGVLQQLQPQKIYYPQKKHKNLHIHDWSLQTYILQKNKTKTHGFPAYIIAATFCN